MSTAGREGAGTAVEPDPPGGAVAHAGRTEVASVAKQPDAAQSAVGKQSAVTKQPDAAQSAVGRQPDAAQPAAPAEDAATAADETPEQMATAADGTREQTATAADEAPEPVATAIRAAVPTTADGAGRTEAAEAAKPTEPVRNLLVSYEPYERRYTTVVWAAAALVVLLVVSLVGYAWIAQPDRPKQRQAARGTAAPGAANGGGASPGAVAGQVGPGGLIGLPEGLTVQAFVVGTGDVQLTERLEWSTEKVPAVIRLSVPASLSGAGIQAGQTVQPELLGLVGSLDGTPLPVESLRTSEGSRWVLHSFSDAPGRHRLELQYTVHNSVLRVTPAPAGRALVVLTPLLLGQATGVPVRLEIAGANVLAVNCPLAPPERMVCGNRTTSGWTVPREGNQVPDLRRVTVQVDLIE